MKELSLRVNPQKDRITNFNHSQQILLKIEKLDWE